MRDKFWQFAAMMLHYKRLLAVAAFGAVLDAACMAGGWTTLTGVITAFFGPRNADGHAESLRETALRKLQSVPAWLGDWTWIANLVPERQFYGLAAMLVIILMLAIVGSFGRFLHEYNTITVSMRTIMRIRKRVFRRLVHLPMTASDQITQTLSRVMGDSATLAGGFSAITSRAVRGVLTGLTMLIVAVWMDWRVVGTFIVVVPPIVILIRKFGKRIRRAAKKALQQYGVMLGALTEVAHGQRVIKVHHAEGYERRRFNTILRTMLKQEMRSRTAKAISSPTIETLAMAGVMIVVLLGGYTVFESHTRSTGELVSVLIMLAGSAMQFRTLTGMNNTLAESGAAAERLDEVLGMAVEPSAREEYARGLKKLPEHSRSVEFKDVSFTYPTGDKPALRHVSLAVPHGKVCAIVGGNGSGKSTLLNLVPRLYEPSGGAVLIDGHDIRQYTLRSVRRQIAMVTQETVLFDATIAENIAYGSRHATRHLVIEAAKRAFAHDFISALPQGYDTELGERGQRLSGGQRQRIAIARAILRDPAILILDEATSQIDADSESKITAALAEFTRNRTTFVIAHRLSTVVNADMIVVMADGQITAIGKHAELLKTSDIYRVLCRTQMIDAGEVAVSG
jgi:ABC-type multidrug transport system fused ATPase/permease subunit